MYQLDENLTKSILKRAEDCAKSTNVAACITLVDASAHLKAFLRMDGAALGPVDVSQRKAKTAALFRRDTGQLGEIIREHSLTGFEQSNGGLAAFPGGLPIFIDNELVGAIGVSGGSAAQDRQIAQHAIQLSVDAQ